MLLIFLIVLSVSAQEIDPRKFIDNKITLSDIADDIKYIPLDDTFPIGSILSHRILTNSIYICTKELGVIRFDKNGRNPIKIGRYERGPGEYATCWSFDVDEKSGTIYVLDWRKIVVFSKKGEFLRSISLPECDEGNCFTRIEFFQNNIFLAEFITNGQAKYDWIIKDRNGNTINEKINLISPFQSRVSARGGTYEYNGSLGYWNYYNDTIYAILPDFSYKSSYLFSSGSHRLPREDIISTSTKQYFSKLNSYFTPQNIFETSKFIWLVYRFDQKRTLALIDKQTKKSYLNYLSNDGTGGILNNIDCGMAFQAWSSIEENGHEYVVGHLDAYKLKTHVESEIFINSSPKYPDMKMNLGRLADTINESDNPIICLVQLKK